MPKSLLIASLAFSLPLHAAISPTDLGGDDRLEKLRQKIVQIERGLISSLSRRNNVRTRLTRTRELLGLLRQEKKLSDERLTGLSQMVSKLEERRESLQQRIERRKKESRSLLESIHASWTLPRRSIGEENEIFESPRRHVISQLVNQSLKTIETLRVDQMDADHLENKIDDERQRLAFLMEDMKEQESLLEFHRRLQIDILRKDYSDRAKHLVKYRSLKTAESRVEDLINTFNARLEFEKMEQIENQVAWKMSSGRFAKQKGLLPLPTISAKVLSPFGQSVDQSSKLKIFRKGIELGVEQGERVSAIFDGKVVYSGRLPRYGNVTILDHGSKFYSICGRLERLERKPGDFIRQGEVLGLAGGSQVYFEIRSGNVPVDPMQWLRGELKKDKGAT